MNTLLYKFKSFFNYVFFEMNIFLLIIIEFFTLLVPTLVAIKIGQYIPSLTFLDVNALNHNAYPLMIMSEMFVLNIIFFTFFYREKKNHRHSKAVLIFKIIIILITFAVGIIFATSSAMMYGI